MLGQRLIFPPFQRPGRNDTKVLPPYAPIANPSTRGAAAICAGLPASLGISPPKRTLTAHRLAGHPQQHGPERVEQFSDMARAAVAVRAASGKPVYRRFQYLQRHRSVIADISHRGNVPWCRGSGVGIPAIRRWTRQCAARCPTKTASPSPGRDSPLTSLLPQAAGTRRRIRACSTYALSARLLRHFGIAIDHEERGFS